MKSQKFVPEGCLVHPDTYWANVMKGLDFSCPYGDAEEFTFSKLEGVELKAIYVDTFHDDRVYMLGANNKLYVLLHIQECCEDVYLGDIVGDVKDLLNTPILMAEENIVDLVPDEYNESATATFYKLATIKGFVDIRFNGSSNGYYSEKAECFVYDLNKYGSGKDI